MKCERISHFSTAKGKLDLMCILAGVNARCICYLAKSYLQHMNCMLQRLSGALQECTEEYIGVIWYFEYSNRLACT